MIKLNEFYECLNNNDMSFFTGVPDSLLKSFCAYIKDNVSDRDNIVAANEGNAIALACGNYLATGKIGVVYMQNSGLGNAVNPLVSLADKQVYNIPMLLIIGWRGEPGEKDEPQHKKQGVITRESLELLNIKYEILDKDISCETVKEYIKEASIEMKHNNGIFAFLVKKGAFEKYNLINNVQYNFEMKRERAIEILLSSISKKSVIVSTTGMASRELFELREKRNESHDSDFLVVGSMGHASSIALGISLRQEERNIYCIDGDGSLIMHLGAVAIIGSLKPKNFRHIIINNGAHDSVGGQETVGLKVNIRDIALACGYKHCYSCSTEKELKSYLEIMKNEEGPILLEVKVSKGARSQLGRPSNTPIENKKCFMKFLTKEINK